MEDVDINGTRTLHGPAYAEDVSSSVEAEQQILLRHLSRRRFSASFAPLLPALRFSLVRSCARSRSRSPAPVGTPRFTVADHVAVKIAVDHEGWYRLTLAQLTASGIDSGTDPRSLHLFAEGIEQPLLYTGHSSNRVSPADTIEFYGTGIDTPYSAERVLLARSRQLHRQAYLAVSGSGFRQHPSRKFPVQRSSRRPHHLFRFAAEWGGQR